MAKGDRIGNRKTREQRRTIKVPELGYYLIVTDTEGTERCFFTGLHQSLPEEVKNKLVIKVVETKTRSMIGNDWTMVLIKEPCYVIDKKVSYSDSRLLIKEILSEMYTDDKNIKKASYRINGIIGSALSHRETMTKEEIYNLLNIKLRRSDIAEFVFHRKFEKFIYSKSVEKGL